jgi:predicted O-methyltransferase YrrM
LVKPFDFLSPTLQKLLFELEGQDRKEREERVERKLRLRQIPRETGEFLYLFLVAHARGYPHFIGVEIGTSGGYSTLWQGAALQNLGFGHLISLDNDPRKHKMALETIKKSSVETFVELILNDAKKFLASYSAEEINYLFLDAEKEDYLDFLELFLEREIFSPGSVLIADNLISHEQELSVFIKAIKESQKVSFTILPVGKGLALVHKH